MSAMTTSGRSALSAVTRRWPASVPSSLVRKKRSTPQSRIVATCGAYNLAARVTCRTPRARHALGTPLFPTRAEFAASVSPVGRRSAAQESGRLDVAAVDVAERFAAGVDLIRRGEFFAAHEELELAWRAAEPAERDFYQGLVHVAVAWYQASRGKATGCGRQLEKAARRLSPYAPSHRGIDLGALLVQLDAARRTVAAGSLALEAPRLSYSVENARSNAS